MELLIEPGRADRQYWRDGRQYRVLFYILGWRDISVRYRQMGSPSVGSELTVAIGSGDSELATTIQNAHARVWSRRNDDILSYPVSMRSGTRIPYGDWF
jgi:hypothetical protein